MIFAHPKDFQAPQDQNKPPTQPAVQLAQPVQPAVQQQHLPAPDLIAGPSGLHQPAQQHDLQPRPDLNYKKAPHRHQTEMQKTLTPSQSRGDKTGARFVLTKTASHGSSFSKHGQPRAIVLTCAILWSCFHQLSSSQTKKPILIDSIFSQPDKLQLRFRPMGNYEASTFISHVRIPFD